MNPLLAVAWRALPVWAVAMTLVGLAELGARAWLADDERWLYWDRTIAEKVRALRELHAAGLAPDVLIVGDSSAAFNIQPDRLDAELGSRSYNLGTPGNYARSFDVVMTRGVLPSLPRDPELLVISFAGHGFRAEALGQTRQVLGAPLARRVLGDRVWGDHLALVRLHHLLRIHRDPPVQPVVRARKGYEPYPAVLERRRRQPGLAARLPPPPAALVRPGRPVPPLDEDPFAPLDRLLAWATDRGIRVALISPPADDRVFVDEMAAAAAARGVLHLDYASAPVRQHNSHLTAPVARLYTNRIARDLREQGLWTR